MWDYTVQSEQSVHLCVLGKGLGDRDYLDELPQLLVVPCTPACLPVVACLPACCFVFSPSPPTPKSLNPNHLSPIPISQGSAEQCR